MDAPPVLLGHAPSELVPDQNALDAESQVEFGSGCGLDRRVLDHRSQPGLVPFRVSPQVRNLRHGSQEHELMLPGSSSKEFTQSIHVCQDPFAQLSVRQCGKRPGSGSLSLAGTTVGPSVQRNNNCERSQPDRYCDHKEKAKANSAEARSRDLLSAWKSSSVRQTFMTGRRQTA